MSYRKCSKCNGLVIFGIELWQLHQKVTCFGQCCSSNLTCDKPSETRRPPVREERPNGTRTRLVDHFSGSGINPSTRPQMPSPTKQWIISCLSYWFVSWEKCPKNCGNVMCLKHSGVFLFSPTSRKIHVGWCLGTKNMSGCPNTNSMPSGSTSAVYDWHRISCLLKDIMVKNFLAACCRYVDDFYGVDPVHKWFLPYTNLQPAGICH